MLALLARTLGVFVVTVIVVRQTVATDSISIARAAIAPDVTALDARISPESDQTCSPSIILDSDSYRRTFRVTAYCDRGITAAGIQSGYGQCAAPADIPDLINLS